MVRSFDQEIPDSQHGKAGFHEREQLLIKHQEFLKREPTECVPSQPQTGCCRTAPLYPKDEKTLAL
jgi:hypothetical protein